MKRYVLLLMLLVCTFCLQAKTVEQYIRSEDGITLFAIISKGSLKERKDLDRFLDLLVKKLKRNDKQIPVHIYTDQFPFFWLRREWFASIGFDTLRSQDLRFIEDYL